MPDYSYQTLIRHPYFIPFAVVMKSKFNNYFFADALIYIILNVRYT